MKYAEEQDDESPKARETVRPDEGPMSKDDLQALVHGIISESVDYVDNELSPSRQEATEYYLGKPFGNEEEGRSQVVMTEVRDAINGMLPGIVRVFFGPERALEFEPRNPTSVEHAEQATDFIQKVFAEDNSGFLKSLEVLKDGLVRRLGVFKYWVEDTPTWRVHKYEGLTEEQALVLADDDDVKLTGVEEREADVDGVPTTVYDIELRRTSTEKRFCLSALNPEHFLYTREAHTIDDAVMVGDRTYKTRGELIAMGIKASVIDEHAAGDDSTLRDHPEEVARRDPDITGPDPDAGEANEKIQYVEAYTKLDIDGDGQAELRKICTIGPNYHVVGKDPVPRRPYALFCPYPEPHTLTGQSAADLSMDLQKLQSSLFRSLLDSAASAIFPRTGYVEGMVSVEDILNTAIGAPIRMRAAGMVQEIAHSFIGKELMPVIDLVNDRVERRLGQNKGAAGLDADALQSSTRQGVTAAITASQAQQEMIARIFAEMTLKPLFRGILELMVENPPRKQMKRLRGKWVEIDPRSWDATMDVIVNVAVGMGTREDRLMSIETIAAKQESIITQMGPQNPLCTLAQYSNTLRRGIALAGHPDVDSFINAVDPNWQPPPAPPQPNPEMALVELEQQKAQISAMHKQQELELKLQSQQGEAQLKAADMEEKLDLERQKLDFEREKLEAEMALKIKELELKYQVQLETARFEAELTDARERTKLDVETDQKERDSQRQYELKAADAQRSHEQSERDSQRKHEIGQSQIAAKRETADKDRKVKKATQKSGEPKEEKAAGPRRVRFVRDDQNRLTGVEDADDPARRIEIVRD